MIIYTQRIRFMVICRNKFIYTYIYSDETMTDINNNSTRNNNCVMMYVRLETFVCLTN